MSFYERFEHVVVMVLSLIAVVIVLALAQLIMRALPRLLTGAVDPLDQEVFQALFGVVMTLLIAVYWLLRQRDYRMAQETESA